MSEEIKIGGFCDPQFKQVKKTFVSHFKKGWEDGASFAVTVNGKFVVDLWAGYADEAHTVPWGKDTIVCTYSTTKIMAVICGLLLSDRGLLDFEAPVWKRENAGKIFICSYVRSCRNRRSNFLRRLL
jgi:CubicO group peptidase (beta-lactamase class C family)